MNDHSRSAGLVHGDADLDVDGDGELDMEVETDGHGESDIFQKVLSLFGVGRCPLSIVIDPAPGGGFIKYGSETPKK